MWENLFYRNNIVDIMSFEDAVELVSLTDLPMETFEEYLWSKYGRRYLGEESLDRINVLLSSLSLYS